MRLGRTAVQTGADGSKVHASADGEALVVYPRAGGGKVTWFTHPDGNVFAIEGDR